MYTRLLRPPSRSFFLFGPRAVGKSTWLAEHFADALTFDLLDARVRLTLLRDPAALAQRVRALPQGSWVVIDEVQMVPDLLSEVQRLMVQGGYRFALSGSSARKLRRGQANLLAGRASVRQMLPLTNAEVGETVSLRHLIERGGLPQVVTEQEAWVDVLESYAMTYLREEIQAEALTRQLGPFSRFLACAALASAQVTNVTAIARDAGVQRPTVQGWFEILQDTLIATLLPAWLPRARIKETRHPKFYWFDTGVMRAMAGRLRRPVESVERGHLLETFVLHELRAHIQYANTGGGLAYWRTAANIDVDFIWSNGGPPVAIEVKASKRWRREYGNGLRALAGEVRLGAQLGVYLGDAPLVDGDLRVLPLREFLAELAAGKVLRT